MCEISLRADTCGKAGKDFHIPPSQRQMNLISDRATGMSNSTGCWGRKETGNLDADLLHSRLEVTPAVKRQRKPVADSQRRSVQPLRFTMKAKLSRPSPTVCIELARGCERSGCGGAVEGLEGRGCLFLFLFSISLGISKPITCRNTGCLFNHATHSIRPE